VPINLIAFSLEMAALSIFALFGKICCFAVKALIYPVTFGVQMPLNTVSFGGPVSLESFCSGVLSLETISFREISAVVTAVVPSVGQGRAGKKYQEKSQRDR
jgi:hypothetical protein